MPKKIVHNPALASVKMPLIVLQVLLYPIWAFLTYEYDKHVICIILIVVVLRAGLFVVPGVLPPPCDDHARDLSRVRNVSVKFMNK